MTEPGRATTRSVAALVALLTAVAACGETPVAPLPVQPPAPSTATPAGAGTPTTAASPIRPSPSTARSAAATGATTVRPSPPRGPTPTRSRSTSPGPTTLPDACFGAVRYDLVLAETELALVRSMCFAAGGVLRIRGIGPGEVTVDREDLVSRSYEAGVVDIRFVRVGTVVVTIPQNGTAYPITVVVV